VSNATINFSESRSRSKVTYFVHDLLAIAIIEHHSALFLSVITVKKELWWLLVRERSALANIIVSRHVVMWFCLSVRSFFKMHILFVQFLSDLDEILTQCSSVWCLYMFLTDNWSGPYDVIAASEPNRLPACTCIMYKTIQDGGLADIHCDCFLLY